MHYSYAGGAAGRPGELQACLRPDGSETNRRAKGFPLKTSLKHETMPQGAVMGEIWNEFAPRRGGKERGDMENPKLCRWDCVGKYF